MCRVGLHPHTHVLAVSQPCRQVCVVTWDALHSGTRETGWMEAGEYYRQLKHDIEIKETILIWTRYAQIGNTAQGTIPYAVCMTYQMVGWCQSQSRSLQVLPLRMPSAGVACLFRLPSTGQASSYQPAGSMTSDNEDRGARQATIKVLGKVLGNFVMPARYRMSNI